MVEISSYDVLFIYLRFLVPEYDLCYGEEHSSRALFGGIYVVLEHIFIRY